jgi:hypothetical protein
MGTRLMREGDEVLNIHNNTKKKMFFFQIYNLSAATILLKLGDTGPRVSYKRQMIKEKYPNSASSLSTYLISRDCKTFRTY